MSKYSFMQNNNSNLNYVCTKNYIINYFIHIRVNLCTKIKNISQHFSQLSTPNALIICSKYFGFKGNKYCLSSGILSHWKKKQTNYKKFLIKTKRLKYQQ